MQRFLFIAFVAALGCDSKPQAEAQPDVGYVPPSISAAPGSEAQPPPKPEEPEPEQPEEEPDPEPPADQPAEAADEAPAEVGEMEPATKSAAKRRSSGGIGSLGTSGDGGGGGGGVASGNGSLDGLLEADAPGTWRVRMLKPDPNVEAETKRLIERHLPSFQRCLSFVKADTNRIRFTVAFEGNAPKSVTAAPPNDTAAECVKAQLANVRFPQPPENLSFEFSR